MGRLGARVSARARASGSVGAIDRASDPLVVVDGYVGLRHTLVLGWPPAWSCEAVFLVLAEVEGLDCVEGRLDLIAIVGCVLFELRWWRVKSVRSSRAVAVRT
jgi:hypothetical protein